MTSGILEQDCEWLASQGAIPWDCFASKRVVVTGATGLIGTSLAGALLAREQRAPTGMRVTALVRNTEKARGLFGDDGNLAIVPWDAADPYANLGAVGGADVIFHCANMTESRAFVEIPVEVIQTTLGGAQAMIEFARRTGARLCLLSTMETYGEVASDGPVGEDGGGFLDAMVVRNSYPEAKRMDEMLCAAYASEYGVDALVVRLAQTFGPGVSYGDGRVFAYFARCALEGTDIVLRTTGEKRNSYLYTADAVVALLTAVAHGERGRAYNAANDATFCSVLEMANMVCDEFGRGGSKVRVELDEDAAKRFRKGSNLRLDTHALQALGWEPVVDLRSMYERMMLCWAEAGRLRLG